MCKIHQEQTKHDNSSMLQQVIFRITRLVFIGERDDRTVNSENGQDGQEYYNCPDRLISLYFLKKVFHIAFS
jgi:hypothetical protein